LLDFGGSLQQQQVLLREPRNKAEFIMLTGLHAAQDEPGFHGLLTGKPTSNTSAATGPPRLFPTPPVFLYER
jgi:hypothetical protein